VVSVIELVEGLSSNKTLGLAVRVWFVVDVLKYTVCVTADPRAPATGADEVVAAMLVTYSVVRVERADAGTVESRPNPNVETATSAMRLRVVFVDICFLSLVVKKTLLFTAGKD
jgi:hypothetical protein